MNSLLSAQQRQKIQDTANQVLQEQDQQQDRSKILLQIAKQQGIEVLEADLYDISGALRQEDGKWKIYVSRQDSQTRQVFTLAHELGHYFLHRDQRNAFVDGGFLMQRNEMTKFDVEELEANEFAGNLLMPEAEIRQRIGDVQDVSAQQVMDLANAFQVSSLAMVTRLKNIGYGVPDRPE